MQATKCEIDGRHGFTISGYPLASRLSVPTWSVLFTCSAVLGVVDGEGPLPGPPAEQLRHHRPPTGGHGPGHGCTG